MRRAAPVKKSNPVTLVLAGALGATVFLALLLGVGFFFYQMGQQNNTGAAPAAPTVIETVPDPAAETPKPTK